MMMGHHVVDNGMFSLVNVCKELWHFKDLASDLLVQILASPDTAENYLLWLINTRAKLLLFLLLCIFFRPDYLMQTAT